MDFRLSLEQEEFRHAVARFVDAEVAPVAREIDEAGEFPRALFRRLGEQGYLALRYPEAYGGADADFVTYCLFAEELARGSMSVAALAAMQSLMGTHFVWKYGSEALRARYLAPALRGDKIATFALTEPNAGSDIGNLATTAERVEGGWRLRGTKTWVTNAPVADMLTVCAKTSSERGMKHIALFLVDRQFPGVTLGKKIDKLGVRASATGEVILDDVFVPGEHLLGGETGGVEKVGGILSEIRVMTGALSVGLGRAAYDAALRYSKERVTFGKPIGEHQAVTFRLVDMLTQLHAASLLVYHAAWCIDQGRPVTREAAMTKLFASEAANRICDEASRIFASYSFATEYPVERYFRDARFLLWGGGTSEILRVIIGRDLDRPAEPRMSYVARGRHFDDFTLGEAFTTTARTVTEGAVEHFAGLSGDFNPLHTDEESARQGPMKGRIAHGVLVLAIATGQVNQLGIFEGTTLALLGMDKIRWTASVKLGDTIHTTLTVKETRGSSKPDRGVLVVDVAVRNQRGETVCQAEWTLMARRR